MKKIVLLLVFSIFLAFSLIACSNNANNNLKSVTVAASPVPHAEILNVAKDLMAEKGYNLQIIEYTDYVQPNKVVDIGEVDVNYFQHKPYLDSFNEEQGTHVVSVGSVHYEPFGLYKGTKNDLSSISDGDKIAVPNDTTNEARALLLLESAGIIKLKENASLTATKLDIVENPNNIDIVELEAAQIPRSLQSVAFACMNANYALEAGFKVNNALVIEPQDSAAAKTYANIICVSEKNKDAEFAKDLLECLKSDAVKNFINNKYEGSVIVIDE